MLYKLQEFVNRLEKMNYSSTILEQPVLQNLLALLQCAVYGHDNESQRKVYDQLSSVEENPLSYIGFAEIAYTQGVQINLRQMAFITLKSALKRNENVIEFSNEQMTCLKSLVMRVHATKNESIEGAQRAVISQLCRWNRGLDYGMLSQLVEGLQTEHFQWAINILYTILEDIRFETENMNLYQFPEFQHFLKAYTEVFAQKIGQAESAFANKLLGCMNLIVKYMDQHSDICDKYLQFYLVPILKMPSLTNQITLHIFDGLTELIQNGRTLILKDAPSLSTVLQYESSDLETMKRWTSFLLDLIDAEVSGQEVLAKYLPLIVPKIIKCLEFTHEDELNVKMEMEEQINPYQYEEDQSEDQQDAYEHYGVGERGYEGGYTLRRLAVMAIDKLLDSYTEDVWSLCHPTLTSAIANSDPQYSKSKEIGILLIGIIFSKIEDHLDFLEKALVSILNIVRSENIPNILKCTSLWCLQKIASLIVREPTIQHEVEIVLLECIRQQNQLALQQKGKFFTQIQHTAYSALDEIVSNSEELPTKTMEIIECIDYGIKICRGRSLHSALKICSTLYQRHSEKISGEITSHIIQRLCEQWSANSTNQSIMSPILECLVTIASGKPEVFAPHYGMQIFQHAVNLLFVNSSAATHKAILIRSIDLVSTLISIKIPNICQALSDANFHEQIVYPLLTNDDRQLKHFGYGLVGDICRSSKIPNFAQTYLETIANNFDKTNLTTSSNALTCMTDLILAHVDCAWAAKFVHSVMAVAVEKLNINNLHQAYAFNFARIYGRLGAAYPQEGASYLPQGLKATAIALRSNQTQDLTNQSFRGIFKMIQASNNPTIQNFNYVAESFICYKSGDPLLQDQFQALLVAYKSNVNQQGWNNFLRQPNFLPAVSRRLEALCN